MKLSFISHLHLRTKILLFTGAVITIIMVAASAAILFSWRSIMLSNSIRSAKDVTKSFAIPVLQEIIKNEEKHFSLEEELSYLLQEYKNEDTNIKFIEIVNLQNKIIAHTDWQKVNVTDSLPITTTENNKVFASIYRNREYGDIIETIYPLHIYGKYWGVMKIGFDAVQLKEKLKGLYFLLFFATIFVILGALTVLYFVSGNLTKAISELVTVMESLDFDIGQSEIFTKGSKESQFLYRKFEEMRDRLNRSKEALILAQKQIYQAEKLASIGRLASGVAHEINNPLNGIKSCLYAINRNPDNYEQNKEYLDLIDEGITNIELIVKKLLGFAHQKNMSIEEVNVNENIKKVLSLLNYRIEQENIEVILNLDKTEPVIKADAQLLQEVFMNLILNSIDAIKQNGKIEITTKIKNGNVIFSVSDNGEGIEEKNLEKIFDPFFTTKEPGKGTGLGLSVSFGIIENFGGTISVKSKRGKGTIITINIPVKNETTID